jgi:hypothetical protein
LLPLGANEKVELNYRRQRNSYQLDITPVSLTDTLMIHLEAAFAASAIDFVLQPGQTVRVQLRDRDIRLNGRDQPYSRKLAQTSEMALEFRQPHWHNDWKSIQIPNYLENKILNHKAKK